MTHHNVRRKSILLPKLIMVCLGGWALASLASVPAPDSIKLRLLQHELSSTTLQVRQNTTDIKAIKQELDTQFKDN